MQLSHIAVRQGHEIFSLLAQWKMLVIGVRGYYRDTMGQPGMNDRRIYDDAIVILTDNVFASFNANCDPNGFRPGHGTGDAKGMASLKPGFWPVYRFDKHKGQYLALCQRAGVVTVLRDGDDGKPYEDTGEFGINIHCGGVETTSSLGCQTLPPSQWNTFIELAKGEAVRAFGFGKWRETTIPYLLLEA